MTQTLQFRRGTTSELSSVSGSVGELFVNTEKDTLVVMDGSTSGGFELVNLNATQTLTNKTLTEPVISTISNTGTLTLPTSTDTIVGRATTDTLTNKTLDDATLTGTLTAGGGVGTSGQILKSTGTGVEWGESAGGLADFTSQTPEVGESVLEGEDYKATVGGGISYNYSGTGFHNLIIGAGGTFSGTAPTLTSNGNDVFWAIKYVLSSTPPTEADTYDDYQSTGTYAGLATDGSVTIRVRKEDGTVICEGTLVGKPVITGVYDFNGQDYGTRMLGFELDPVSVGSTAAVESATNQSGDGLNFLDVITSTSIPTLEAGERYLVSDLASGKIELPASPSVGDEVTIVDVNQNFGTNALTVKRNGSNIFGQAADLSVDEDGSAFTLIYTGSTQGWVYGTNALGGSTAIDASIITSGTLPNARLSSDVTQNTATQTLTNKTISADDNTITLASDDLSDVPTLGTANQVLKVNSGATALEYVNGSITINGTAINLGGSTTIATGLTWESKSSSFTAEAGKAYYVDTSGGAITATLPASPSQDDEVRFLDVTGSFDTNNLTVGRNSEKIQGDASDLTVATERAGFALVYYNSTQGWLIKDK